METLEQGAAAIRACGPWRGHAVVLACSGGADSTFLARAWRLAAAARDAAARDAAPDADAAGAAPPPARVVVVDHGHRPGTAAEARAACALYRAMGLDAEVRPAGAAPGANEDALRRARYAVLTRAAREHGAAAVLTAHHADDLAETVLLRILRGTGLRGLAGIPPRRRLAEGVELLRPLLGLRRAAIRAGLRAAGQEWIEDPSNEALGPARNRLRHELMPALGDVATGDPVVAVLRLAREARQWNADADRLLAAAPDWRALPSTLRRRAVAAALRACGATPSPARLADLEGALLARGRAGVDARRRLELRHGRLVTAAAAG